jgi:hypothetical protein
MILILVVNSVHLALYILIEIILIFCSKFQGNFCDQLWLALVGHSFSDFNFLSFLHNFSLFLSF